MLTELWNYRGFILASVKREFQAQYCKSILGATWIVMNPLYMVVLYTSIFSHVMQTDTSNFSYTIYVASGLLTWNLFIDFLNKTETVYLNYANIIRKLYFPHLCLPIIVLIMVWINFSVSFGIFSGYLIVTGAFPGWCYVALIPILILQTFFALGLGNILGILNVFFRDTGKMMVVLLQVWFWMTPIVYVAENLPASMQRIIRLNPMTEIIGAYQTILVKHQWPVWHALWYSIITITLLSLILMLLYRRTMSEIL